MKKLFTAIKNYDFETVESLINKNPELVNCVAKQPPKKDDGQSPLQIALKNGAFEIASFLIDNGADVNFIESEDCANEWRAPVIHDAINAAIMNSRYNTYDSDFDDIELFNEKEDADEAFLILKKVISAGADVNACDSYGNSCVWRFCLQSAQILPSFHWSDKVEIDDRILTDELFEDLTRILDALKDAGMDMLKKSPSDNKTVFEFYESPSLLKILNND